MKISPRQVSEELKQGNIRLIDVRTPLEYSEVHIEGAELMPLDKLNPDEVKGSNCVTICRSGKRASSAAKKLEKSGCENVRVMEGGMMAWEDAGLPVERGDSVISLERQVRIAAGLLVLVGVILGTWLNPWFYALSAFVGAGLTFAGITDFCGMGLLLAKAPWNQRGAECCSKATA